MIKIITCGKAIASYPVDGQGFLDAHRHAITLSKQNRDLAVYMQEGNSRSIYRNGYAL